MITAWRKEPQQVPFGWDTGWGKGGRRDTKGHTEGDKGKEDWLQTLFPGWTTGNFDGPAQKLRLLGAGTGEPPKVPE